MTKDTPQPGMLSLRPDSGRKKGPFLPCLPVSLPGQSLAPERGQRLGSSSLQCLWLGSWEEDAYSGPAPNQGGGSYRVFSLVVPVEGEIGL